MCPAIVDVVVSQRLAPIPSTLQRTGAMISQGGTNTAPGTVSFITQLSDYTPLMPAARAVSAMTWTSNVVTVTTAAPHGLDVGDVMLMTIGGVTPVAYNGTFTATITGASTFTYPLIGNPGPVTVQGVYTLQDVAQLNAMLTTFFAQGNSQPVFILEFGPGTSAEGVTALSNWLIANATTPQPLPGNNQTPARFYSYLVPREWDTVAAFKTLLQSYQAPSSMTYFHVTTTLATRSGYTALNKCVIAYIEAPAVNPLTEFSAAAGFRKTLSYRPSATNKVTPFNFSYVYGVTPYPTVGNSALLQTLKNEGVNIISTGAEGGISNTILVPGRPKDGYDFTYWYSADWCAINIKLNVANAIINGSNNPVNPLYYNQAGINVLQSVIGATMTRGITFGLVLGAVVQTQLDGPDLDAALDANKFPNQTVVNAVPFVTYSNENPGDYKIGEYDGFSTIYVPSRGFDHILFQLVLSDFVSS